MPSPAAMALGPFCAALESAAAQPQPEPSRTPVEPLTRISAQPAGGQPERPKPAIPRPGLFLLEYYCQGMAGVPAIRLEWMDGPHALMHRPFALALALRPSGEYPGRRRKLLAFEEFLGGRRSNQGARARMHYPGKIAATIMVGVALWAGNRLANLTGDEFRAQVERSERSVSAAAAVRHDDDANGPVARVRRAIASRAATQVTDTFASGMEAWGAPARNWAPGWQYSRDGYVRTGEMALFRPSLQYSDYRMEFYGQIESQSMGWVVRARDKQNYYAMKFTVIEPGLRPIIAMVHYQVTNGKRGHAVATPLSVMVHNNRPYHVSVDVRGNHFAAAIEGEPVESWTDDTPAQGGVGFFSEAGEHARLYWMRVSRNQDWLGRFCAYLSGDSKSGQQVAGLWLPDVPWPAPLPALPRVPRLALLQAGLRWGEDIGPGRKSHNSIWRVYTWNS
jgi:hypothetical protein